MISNWLPSKWFSPCCYCQNNTISVYLMHIPMLMILFRSKLEFEWSAQPMGWSMSSQPPYKKNKRKLQANLCYSARHSSLHFDVLKLASVCWIPYGFRLCTCYRLSLTLDDFINDLYEQSIFWFNGCLNASFIIYCSVCNFCLKPPNKALQFGLLA